MARLYEKDPDARFIFAQEDDTQYFVCEDCAHVAFAPYTGFKLMAEHLEDGEHRSLVEARVIRDSAIPGAEKHKRMVIVPHSNHEKLHWY